MASYPRLSTPRILRHRPDIDEHAQKMGKIIWEWNSLHSHLFLIFWLLLGEHSGDEIPGEPSRQKALALWHTVQSDDLQRKMLLAVANTTKTLDSKIRVRLIWAIKMADVFAPYRNIIAHVPMSFEYEDEITFSMPDILSSRPTALRRFIYMSTDFWNDLADDLFVLGQYTEVIRDALISNERFRWPRRPRLLCLPNILEVNRRISVRGERKAPRRPRGASSN